MGLVNEPPDLIGRRSFAITTRWQEIGRPDREPQGVGTSKKVATDLPNNWTRDGTEMLLGQFDCQGETGNIVIA